MIISTRHLILTTAIALLGGILPKLRAVSVGCHSEHQLSLSYFYDGEVSETDRETVACAETELLAAYWEEYDPIRIDCSAQRTDSPQPVPWKDMLIYHRYEQDFKLTRDPFPYAKLDSAHLDQAATRLVALRALLGTIIPELRRVSIEPDQMPIEVYFYYDGPIFSLAIDQARRVSSFISQQIDNGKHTDLVDIHLERLDYPQRLPTRGSCIYSRYEPIPPKQSR